jgi:predicted membrane protein
MSTQENRNLPASRLLLGLVIIGLGVLYLLDNLNLINFSVSYVIFSWPMVITIVGLSILLNARRKFFGTMVFLVGLFLLIIRVFPNINIDADIIWPLIVIAVGLSLLFQRSHVFSNGHGVFFHHRNENIDKIDDVAVFGGGEKSIRSDNFQGGNITAIFGGSQIDFVGCKLAEGRQYIDIVAIFGGTTLIVPKEWNVVLDIFPIFGGFSKKGYRMFDTETDKSRTLVIKGVVIFGGGEVRFV